jgi:hypothetical protein
MSTSSVPVDPGIARTSVMLFRLGVGPLSRFVGLIANDATPPGPTWIGFGPGSGLVAPVEWTTRKMRDGRGLASPRTSTTFTYPLRWQPVPEVLNSATATTGCVADGSADSFVCSWVVVQAVGYVAVEDGTAASGTSACALYGKSKRGWNDETSKEPHTGTPSGPPGTNAFIRAAYESPGTVTSRRAYDGQRLPVLSTSPLLISLAACAPGCRRTMGVPLMSGPLNDSGSRLPEGSSTPFTAGDPPLARTRGNPVRVRIELHGQLGHVGDVEGLEVAVIAHAPRSVR